MFLTMQRANLCTTVLAPYLHLDAQVARPGTEISLNAKAWNGRVICAWLAETMPVAARGFPPGFDEGRLGLTCHALTLGFISS